MKTTRFPALLGIIALTIALASASLVAYGATGPTVSASSLVPMLKAAQDANQILLVMADESGRREYAADGSRIHRAVVSLLTKESDGTWTEVVSSNGFIGRRGLGKTREGDRKTPIGIYHFTNAFGIAEDPGCAIPYVQVDNTYYWVGDSNSQYYNRFETTKEVLPDWNNKASEHLVDYKVAYQYALALDYNAECTPGLGSAIFLHCSQNRSTGGCISVPQDDMITIMQNVQPDCLVIIDYASRITQY